MRTLIIFIISIFIPGAGQIISKDYFKGVIMILLAFGTSMIFNQLSPEIPFFIIMIWSLVDLFFKTEKAEGKQKAIKYLIFSIIVVIILIPAVFYLSIFSFVKGGNYLKNEFFNQNNTEKEMKEISIELDKYFAFKKTYPVHFSEFVNSKPIWRNWESDSWGNPYHYTLLDSSSYALVSAGQDLEIGTDDDILKSGSKKSN
tara:strand:+ start:2833 stop:3435 length:603 start_codon:yes stop_codon:yes gene_type:complete